MRIELAKAIELKESRFGMEPELVARLARVRIQERDSLRAIRIYEVAVGYAGRTYAEGKKIGWRDGFRALWCIFRDNTFGARSTTVTFESHDPSEHAGEVRSQAVDPADASASSKP